MNLPNTNFCDSTYLQNNIAMFLRHLRYVGLNYSMLCRSKLVAFPALICVSGILLSVLPILLIGGLLLVFVTCVWTDNPILERIANAISLLLHPSEVIIPLEQNRTQAIPSLVLPVPIDPPRQL